MNIPQNCVLGTFICEEKNRFLCTVDTDGTQKLCYIASSCRLENFIELQGKTVLLKPTSTPKASTEYSVFGVKHKQSYILLNTSMANRAIENSIHSRKLACFGKRKKFLKEHKIEDYKADFFLPQNKTLIEIKSVISMTEEAPFPTVFSERTLRQLAAIERMLKEGYSARFVIVSLNPYVKRVRLQPETPFCAAIRSCVDCGLQLDAFTCRLGQDGVPYIDRRIPIIEP